MTPARRLVAALAVAGLAALAGCGGATGGGDLDGGWLLLSGMADGEGIPVLDDHPITLTIDGTAVAGTAACNDYRATMTRDEGSVSLSGLVVTEMACLPGEVMDSERIYLDALRVVDTAVRADDLLRLSGPGVELLFRSSPPPA